jgi:hypothetical protein
MAGTATADSLGARVTWIVLLVVLAAGLRLAGARHPHPIHRDGLQYLASARAAAAGDWRRVAANEYTPGYPALTAGALRLGGGDVETAPAWHAAERRFAIGTAEADAELIVAALTVSAVCGSLAVVPAYLVGVAVAGPTAGLWSAAVMALHPYHALYSGYVLSEAAFFLFLLLAMAAVAGLARAERPGHVLAAGAGVGLAAACGFCVRPEVLALTVPAGILAIMHRRRWLALAGMLLSFAAVVVPFLVAYNQDPTRGGLRLAPKKSLAWLGDRLLGAPGEVLSSLGRNVVGLSEYGHPLLIILALGGLVLALRAGDRAARRIGGVALAGALLYLGVASVVREDRRFALGIATLLMPFAGCALARLHAVVQPRWGIGRTSVVFGIVLAAATVPILLHKSRAKRPQLLDAAASMRARADGLGLARPPVLVRDARLGFYAGGEVLALAGLDQVIPLEEAARRLTAGEIRLIGLTEGREPSVRELERLAPAVRFEVMHRAGPPPGERGLTYLVVRALPR